MQCPEALDRKRGAAERHSQRELGSEQEPIEQRQRPARAGAGADGARRTGAGLASMAERVASVGGSLEAGPGPAGGWRVRIAVPAPAAGAAAERGAA